MNEDSFIYQAHCEKGSPSSKRLYGGIGWTTVQICIIAATILSLCISHELSSTIKDLLEVDLITSASLLGLSTITGVFGANKKVSASNTDSNNAEEDEDV